MIYVKSKSDIEKMKEGGKILAQILLTMQEMAQSGSSTKQMDAEAERIILLHKAYPSFKGYNGFKYATCMSVDDVVVHGFPSDRKLMDGELLSVDIGLCLNGFHVDAARTFAIGTIEPRKRKLIEVTEQCFFEGVKHAYAGKRLGDMSSAIQEIAERNGFSVVRSMTGHGIGRQLHEDPSVYNYGKSGMGIMLKPGYALAIEPMVNMGGHEVYIDPHDKWTCRTKDGQVSAHYENTVIITDGEPEIITL